MLSVLILITCSATGGNCRPVVISDQVPYFTCALASQREAAKYVNEHPNRKVERMICADPKRVPFYLHRDEA